MGLDTPTLPAAVVQGRSHAARGSTEVVSLVTNGVMDAPSPDPSELSKLYTFAVWMLGGRVAGVERAGEVVRAAPDAGFVGWAQALLTPLTGPRARKGPRAERQSFLGALDEMLRTELTVSPGDHPTIQRDPRRLRVLQWELKRTCLVAVMQGVAPGPRATFILIKILGFSEARLTSLFGVTTSSVAVNLGRAERALDNYLGVRCQHLARGNTCRCETRLGVALAQGFIGWPAHPEELPDAPIFSQTHSDVGALYGSLPGFIIATGAPAGP